MSKSDDVRIRIFGSTESYAEQDLQDESRVVELIRKHILPATEAEYHRIDVKIRRDQYARPNYLVAYLLRKDIYLAEMVRIDVDENYDVLEVKYGYDDTTEDEEEAEGNYEAEDGLWDEEGYAIDFVAATPVPEIGTAKEAVEKVYDLVKAAGFKVVKLLGKDATVANYKNYLKSGLKGFVNIGHGSKTGIMLYDGVLSSSWFDGLTGNPLKPCVVYFNSCQVCNEPLKASIMKAGARTFIGGIVNLLIGPSEKVCMCFWETVLKSTTHMNKALETCEKKHYPSEGAHGIVGDIGPFAIEKLLLSYVMWVHGHDMKVEFPERLTLQQPMGFYMRIKGKPFTSNWLHYAIATPAVAGCKRQRAGVAVVRFRTGPGASVKAVHVYDGEKLIAVYNNLNLISKDIFRSFPFEVPSSPYLYRGLGISIGVGFGDSANLPPDKLFVEVSAAGCTFLVKAPAPALEIDGETEEMKTEFTEKPEQKKVTGKKIIPEYSLS